MKPSEIVDAVLPRFGLLLYHGYAAGEEPQTDDDGKTIYFPREIRRTLRSYSEKVGVRETLGLEAGDLSTEKTVELPFAWRGLDACADDLGVYVKCREDRAAGLLKFAPKSGWENFYWPLRVSYYVDLSVYIADDLDLPPSCDTDLLCDYLEALVGPVNAQYNQAMDSFDIPSGSKTAPEYEADRKECEETMKSLRSLPDMLATGF